MSCSLNLDPTQTRAVLDACLAIIGQPDSGPNFLRGVFAVCVLAVVLIGAFSVVRAALSSR